MKLLFYGWTHQYFFTLFYCSSGKKGGMGKQMVRCDVQNIIDFAIYANAIFYLSTVLISGL
jgi:hypothetical protein